MPELNLSRKYRPRVAAVTGWTILFFVLLRVAIGWHFLYEGLVKLVWPAWTRAGVPLGRFSSAGYLRSSTGPFADLFRAFADASWLPWLDLLMGWGLLLAGLGLMLGLFTQLACAGAIALLTLFYLSWVPTSGVAVTGTEGNYLFVNKNLVEAAPKNIKEAVTKDEAESIKKKLEEAGAKVTVK